MSDKLEQITEQEWSEGLLKFVNQLKAEPTKTDIKINELAKKSKYIPIGIVEDKLDYFFSGMWETKDFQWSVIVNEICCSITLRVLHPVTRTWIERVGVGATQIQIRTQKDPAGNALPTDPTDVSKKIVNTVQKDLPHAKAEAIKNAAKSLGRIFGRDLNRDTEDAREVMTLEDAEIKITSCETKKELKEFYDSLPNTMKSDKKIKEALLKQQTFLNQKS